jgi:hypothetical protein
MQGYDYFWGAGYDPISFFPYIGPHHMPGDSMRYHVTWLYSDDKKVLEIPPVYLDSRLVKGLTTPTRDRRQAEHDDHGEAYAPRYYDGPHIFYDFEIPRGLFVLSIYDVNKEEHNLRCPYRDFPVIVYRGPSRLGVQRGLLPTGPASIVGRINHFWEGKYTRLLIRGPSSFTLEINRNYSFDTIVAGLMVDSDEEEPAPYFESEQQSRTQMAKREDAIRTLVAQYDSDRAAYVDRFGTGQDDADAADKALSALEELRLLNPQQWAAESDDAYALLLRSYHERAEHTLADDVGKPALLRRLGTCYYWSGLFDKWEATQVARRLTTARAIEKSLRWSQTISGYSGLGYQTVVNALANLKNRSMRDEKNRLGAPTAGIR